MKAFEYQPVEYQPLLEVLPLNSEQRQAVLQSLNNALTVITGPPGTGKSQVVTSILINAAWKGKKVLFASKNNKAVDVVETRVNALGPRPILLRLGGDLYQGKLAEYLVSLLAASISPEDEENYQFQFTIHAQIQEQFKNLNKELEKLIRLRNQVDHLEQEVESIRSEIGDTLFGSFRDVDFQELQAQVKVFQAAIMQADINMQNIFIRGLWFFFKNKRYRLLQEALNDFLPFAEQIGIEFHEESANDEINAYWCSISPLLDDRITYIDKVQHYFQTLKQLTNAKPLEQVSYDVLGLTEQLSETSEFLWEI